MEKDYSQMDGELVNYEVIQGPAPLTNNYEEDFYPASGGGPFTRGIFKGTILDKNERKKRRTQRQSRKDSVAKTNADAVKALSKADAPDTSTAAIVNALKTPATKTVALAPPTTGGGMSVGVKIGIGVLVVAVIGGIIYAVKRKKK